MNAATQESLAKYMLPTGYYNTARIREDEGMSEAEAGWLSIFGDDEDITETKSELLIAAEAHNDAKMAADTANEQAQNTPEAVYENLKQDGVTVEVIKQTESMTTENFRRFVGMLVTELDTINDMSAGADKQAASSSHNRILYMLEKLHLATEYGDIADQAGGVSIAKARQIASNR